MFYILSDNYNESVESVGKISVWVQNQDNIFICIFLFFEAEQEQNRIKENEENWVPGCQHIITVCRD